MSAQITIPLIESDALIEMCLQVHELGIITMFSFRFYLQVQGIYTITIPHGGNRPYRYDVVHYWYDDDDELDYPIDDHAAVD